MTVPYHTRNEWWWWWWWRRESFPISCCSTSNHRNDRQQRATLPYPCFSHERSYLITHIMYLRGIALFCGVIICYAVCKFSCLTIIVSSRYSPFSFLVRSCCCWSGRPCGEANTSFCIRSSFSFRSCSSFSLSHLRSSSRLRPLMIMPSRSGGGSTRNNDCILLLI